MSNVGVEVRGLKDFQRALKHADAQMQSNLASALRRIAGKVKNKASALAPKKSTALANSFSEFATQTKAGFRTWDKKAGVQEFADRYRRRGRGGPHPMGPHTVTMRNVQSKGKSGGRFAFKARDEMEDWIEDEVMAAVLEAARAEGWLG